MAAFAFGLFGSTTVAITVAVASCGGAEPEEAVETALVDPSPTSEAATATSVPVSEEIELPVGATWVLESLDGEPVVGGSFVEIEIGEEWAGGSDGCNGYSGRTEDGGAIFGAEGSFTAPLMAVTAMLCSSLKG